MKASVIVPAVNEEVLLERTLERARAGSPHESIVADGGSRDRTCQIARKYGKVVKAEKPWRSVMMNAAARTAEGDWLVFLHPDTLLPNNWQEAIPKQAGAAAFSLKFDTNHWLLNMTAWYSNKVRLPRGMVFGDHCLCVRRELFEQLGGFKPISIFEDVEFSRRLRKRAKIHRIRKPVITSARRYVCQGPLKQFFINQLMKVLYAFGVHHVALRRIYRGLK